MRTPLFDYQLAVIGSDPRGSAPPFRRRSSASLLQSSSALGPWVESA